MPKVTHQGQEGPELGPFYHVWKSAGVKALGLDSRKDGKNFPQELCSPVSLFSALREYGICM